MHVYHCSLPAQLFVWQIEIRYRQYTVNLQTNSCESATVPPVFMCMGIKTFNLNYFTALHKNVQKGLVRVEVFLSPVNRLFVQKLVQTNNKRHHHTSASLAHCAGNTAITGGFPAQNASNMKSVFIILQ